LEFLFANTHMRLLPSGTGNLKFCCVRNTTQTAWTPGALGCIFAEMITRQPLFPGDSEIDQLFRIFRSLGTPTEDSWPGVTKLPDFKPVFPRWQPQNMHQVLPVTLSEGGHEMMSCLLAYNPATRFSARQALKLPYLTNSPLCEPPAC